jgi:hypothetical protein
MLAFFLFWKKNKMNFKIVLGWEREYSWKTPVWEQVHLTFLNVPDWGSRISRKIPSWKQVQQKSFRKFLENSGQAKCFIQPTEVNHIPGQEKFDH